MAEPEPKPDRERSRAKEEAKSPSLSEVSRGLFVAGQRFVQDVGELLGLETRRAFQALTWMVALAVITGLLGAATWFSLVAAAYVGLMGLGIASWVAFLVLAGANLLGAIASVMIIRRLSSALLFRATRRVLLGAPRLGESKYEPAEPQNTRT